MFNRYYSLNKILSKNADYNLIIGERSNGKTYACLKYAIENVVENGSQFAYLRRWAEDIRGKRGSSVFNALNTDGTIKKLTRGKYSIVNYYAGKFFFANYDDKLKKYVNSPEPIGYLFALTNMEHDKSTSYPLVNTVIFDEFLTRKYYLPDEFVMFMNVISTIVRHRENVKIFMLGNTVNKYCPYFKEMGLTKVENQKKGTIDLYSYGESTLKVAVEYCGNTLIKKGSDKYFAFDNPKLKMITKGEWEIDLYPHLPYKYKFSEILFIYFIIFDGYTLQCEIINHENQLFTYIHLKTTPLKNSDTDLIYSFENTPRENYVVNIKKPRNKLETRVLAFFVNHKVFYQDNSVGEIVRNYMNECDKM